MTHNQNPTQPTDQTISIESRILDMLHAAKLENVDSVRAAADGYCVTFTGAGKYLITDALRAAVVNAGLKIVASNGKSLVVAAPKAVTDGSDAYAHFAKGDTAIRKSDGVEFKVTDVRGDCISGVGTRVKTTKKEGKTIEETIPVYVEMAHRKHFRAVEAAPALTPTQQAEQIANAETSEQTIAHVDAILAKPEELIIYDKRRYMGGTIGWDYDKQISADDIEEGALDDTAPEPFADDDLYPPDPLDYTPAERKPFDDDFTREIYKALDAEEIGDIIEMPELTPAQRFAMTAYADEPKADEPEVKDDDTAKLPSVEVTPPTHLTLSGKDSDGRYHPDDLSEVAQLSRRIEYLQAELDRARDINRDLAEQLADERMINAARKELVEMLSEQAQNPDPEPKTVECEETFETPPAEYARHINGQWKVAYQQRHDEKLYVMWVREIIKPSDQLEAAMNAALERAEAKHEDPFAAVPKDVMAFGPKDRQTLESITS